MTSIQTVTDHKFIDEYVVKQIKALLSHNEGKVLKQSALAQASYLNEVQI